MNEHEIARNIIQRLTGGRVIQLPKMAEQDVIDYIDYMRIPESLERCERYPYGSGIQTIADVDTLRQWCLETLGRLDQARAEGLPDEIFYRLTSKREIPQDERLDLRDHIGCFVPQPFGVIADGRRLYLVNTHQGWQCVTLEKEGWTLYTPPA